MQNSYIEHHANGGSSFVGEPATRIYQAKALRSGLQLMKQGIKPNRAWTKRNVLASVERLTGARCTSYDAAILAVTMWLEHEEPKVEVRRT